MSYCTLKGYWSGGGALGWSGNLHTIVSVGHSLPLLVNTKCCHPKEPWEKCFPSQLKRLPIPHRSLTYIDCHLPPHRQRQKTIHKCCDYLCGNYYLSPRPPSSPPPLTTSHHLFPSPTLTHSFCLLHTLPSLPLKTAAQPEASKAGFTQQSSSRENGCCFQVLFAHLSGGDRSGENGVCGMQFFVFFLTSLYSKLHA